MKLSLRSLASLCVLSLVASSFGWIDTGHMIIAAIAEGRLDSKAYDECARLMKIGATDKAPDFIQSASWADDTKNKETGIWHYIDIPFRTDGKPTTTTPDEKNVVWAINHFSDILKDKTKPDADRAEALRYLIHFVGDVHQPLHATTMESEEHPKGDRGGNDVKIKAADLFPGMERPPTNLHFLWDMGCGAFMPGLYPRPLTGENEAKLRIASQDLSAQYPPTSFYSLVKDLDPKDWAKESSDAAQQYVYKVRTGGEIDVAYAQIGKTIATKRAVLAGYRLAALLNKLVGKG